MSQSEITEALRAVMGRRSLAKDGALQSMARTDAEKRMQREMRDSMGRNPWCLEEARS